MRAYCVLITMEEVGTGIIPITQMRKLRHSDVTALKHSISTAVHTHCLIFV